MDIPGIVFGILCICLGAFFVLVSFNCPPEIPPQYPCVTVHKEGNKTIFRYDDGTEIIYEYKAPKKVKQNSSKVVSVDSEGFTISTPGNFR